MFIMNSFPALNLGFPDVCMTVIGLAPVPVPYPNIAIESSGFPFPPNIFIGGSPVHNLATTLVPSQGDLPGFSGVGSGTVLGTGNTFVNSNTVLHGALPTKRVTSMGTSNLTNSPSIASTPNNFSVLLLAP
jgi:hypothetical protein